MVRRAFIVCSTEEFQQRELSFLKDVFTKVNGYPSKVVSGIIFQVRRKMTAETSSSNTPLVTPEEPPIQDHQLPPPVEEVHTPYICLPYKGEEGEHIISGFRNALRQALPINVKPRIIFKGTKLGSCFRIKDKVPTQHESNLVYRFKSPEEEDDPPKYIGQTKVRYGTRTYEHCCTDKASAVYKYKTVKNIDISANDFEIIERGFSKTVDRKLAEALYVKEEDPILNRQKKTFPILLFN